MKEAEKAKVKVESSLWLSISELWLSVLGGGGWAVSQVNPVIKQRK